MSIHPNRVVGETERHHQEDMVGFQFTLPKWMRDYIAEQAVKRGISMKSYINVIMFDAIEMRMREEKTLNDVKGEC